MTNQKNIFTRALNRIKRELKQDWDKPNSNRQAIIAAIILTIAVLAFFVLPYFLMEAV